MPGGGGMRDLGACMLLGDMHVCQGAYLLPGNMHVRWWRECITGGHVCHACPPPPMPRDTVGQ